MTKADLAWAAGFFDGEGCIRVTKAYGGSFGSLVVSISNTDIEPLEWIQERWPATLHRCSGQAANRKQAWIWIACARKALPFLIAIRPFVRRSAVRRKIDRALAFQAGKRDNVKYMSRAKRSRYIAQQLQAYDWFAKANKRGKTAA